MKEISEQKTMEEEGTESLVIKCWLCQGQDVGRMEKNRSKIGDVHYTLERSRETLTLVGFFCPISSKLGTWGESHLVEF